MFELRDYQTEIIEKISKSMRAGHKRIIVQSPPRTGKTVVMAEIAHQTTLKGNRVMFLIHRKEVLEQAIDTFKKQEVNANLLQAGMVQTLSRRVDKLKEPNLILIDEAHHALAKSYQKVLKKFSHSYVLLFTATPVRTGRQQLDQIADDIVVGESIQDLTKKGFLAPFRYFQPPGDFNLKDLKKSSTGDYTKKSMDEAISTKLFGNVIKQYQKLASGKQAVVYAHSIEAAKDLKDEFVKAGISAAEVDGGTLPHIRDETVKQFRDKKIKILVNVNLFTEGVDLPNVDCVIMARPTASLSLYLQFAMRCLNPRPGKMAIIIDHANNFKSFGYPDDDRDWKKAIITRKKGGRSNTTPEVPITTCEACFAVIRPQEIKDGKCPICGNPVKAPVIKEKVADVDLVERKQRVMELVKNEVVKNVVNKSVSELKTMKELKAYAQLHDYKPGWAYFMAKKKGILR